MNLKVYRLRVTNFFDFTRDRLHTYNFRNIVKKVVIESRRGASAQNFDFAVTCYFHLSKQHVYQLQRDFLDIVLKYDKSCLSEEIFTIITTNLLKISLRF